MQPQDRTPGKNVPHLSVPHLGVPHCHNYLIIQVFISGGVSTDFVLKKSDLGHLLVIDSGLDRLDNPGDID